MLSSVVLKEFDLFSSTSTIIKMTKLNIVYVVRVMTCKATIFQDTVPKI